MTNTPWNMDMHLLAGAYALDALDPTERLEFETHLAECPTCADEVASFRETGSTLAALSPVAPPPELRDRVLASISTVRPLPPKVEPTTASRSSRRWWTTSLLVAAVSLLMVGLVWRPWSTDTATDPVQAVMAASDAQKIEQQLEGGGTVTIYRSVSLNQSAAVSSDLPELPNDEVYQIWYQDPAGSMVPAALMPSGTDSEVLLEGSATDSTAAGITVEPEGGSPSPTTEPVALFPFSNS